VWLVTVDLPVLSVRNYRPHGVCSPVYRALIRWNTIDMLGRGKPAGYIPPGDVD